VNDTGFFQRILFCTDFSENANLAFDFALDAARRRPGSVIYLLHIIPEPEAQFWRTYLYEVEGLDEKARRDMDERISEQYLPRVPQGVDVRVEIRIGKDHEEILNFARENKIDLIVLGREGEGSTLRRTFFGNVAEKVTSKAECAVLVAPLSFCRKCHEKK
jgi:nucleotide-binding universal stress UspA family protein